jgi:plasmid stabilization system protein ParE
VSGYILSSDADSDLEEIWDYIAADNVDAADRWIEKLFDAFDALAPYARNWSYPRGSDWLSSLVLARGRVSHHLSWPPSAP